MAVGVVVVMVTSVLQERYDTLSQTRYTYRGCAHEMVVVVVVVILVMVGVTPGGNTAPCLNNTLCKHIIYMS